MPTSRQRPLLLAAAAVVVPFTLACSGFNEAMNEGLKESANEALSEAGKKLAGCDEGQNRATLEKALEKLEAQLRAEEVDGMTASFQAGLVIGVADDGCTDASLDAARQVAPDLLSD